jgi:hypothetical protein
MGTLFALAAKPDFSDAIKEGCATHARGRRCIARCFPPGIIRLMTPAGSADAGSIALGIREHCPSADRA